LQWLRRCSSIVIAPRGEPRRRHRARALAFIAAASVIGTGTAFAAVASPGAASNLSSGCQLVSLLSSTKNVTSASTPGYAFNAGERVVVAFSNPLPKATTTTGTLTVGIAPAMSGLASRSGPVPGSVSYTFQASGTYALQASVNGSAVMTFSCSLTDTDLALNVPANITANAASPRGAAVTFAPPTVVDEDAPLPAATCDHASGDTFPIGTTTVTCSVTDSDDTPGTVSASFTVTVTDTDLALVGMPADVSLAATSSAGAVATFTPPTAVDEDTPAPAVTCDHASGDTFLVGTTTVTCSATDPDDTPGTVSASFTVTVTDADLGLTGVPGDISLAATSSAGAVATFTPPTAVDEDTPLPGVTCDHASGSVFPVGTTTVTCSATDLEDTPSTVSASFTVTVNDADLGLTAAPADMTVNGGPNGTSVTYTPPTAVDEDSPLPPVTCDHPSGSVFPVGTTTVTCTVTDTDDTPSSVSVSFNVTVNDPPPPDTDLGLTGTPADITVKSGPNGTSVTYTPPTAVDEDSPLPPVTCDHPSGSVFPVGTTTVTCTVTDTDDTPSSVSVSFNVTVSGPPQGIGAQLKQLEAAVSGDKSLREKVERAEGDLVRHDTRGVCRELDNFVDAIGEQHHPKMTKAAAAALIAGVQRIEAALGCPKPPTHHATGDDDTGAHGSTGKPAPQGGNDSPKGPHPS
jgi:hypothetical protein